MKSINSFVKILSFFLIACSSDQVIKRQKRSEFESNTFMKSESFFLPKRQEHLNFSTAGKCFYKEDLIFLDFKNINQSYGLSYEKINEAQAYINFEMSKDPSKYKGKVINEILEKLAGKVRFYDFPQYEGYNFIWIDGLSEVEKKKWLKKFLDSKYMENGVPILISLCDSSYEILKFLEREKLDADYPYWLGAEIFNNYGDSFEYIPYFRSKISTPFKKDASFKLIKSNVLKDRKLNNLIVPSEMSEVIY